MDLQNLRTEKNRSACFPGKYMPTNLEKNEAKNIPLQTLFLKEVEEAYSSIHM